MQSPPLVNKRSGCFDGFSDGFADGFAHRFPDRLADGFADGFAHGVSLADRLADRSVENTAGFWYLQLNSPSQVWRLWMGQILHQGALYSTTSMSSIVQLHSLLYEHDEQDL